MESRLNLRAFRGRSQQGVSLVEILVGVAIGLIGIVMMFQLMQNWETRKRTTSAGSDAQVSGSIASYRLATDIRQGGYGFGNGNTVLGCNVSAYDSMRATTNFSFPLLPVEIVEGGTDPDQIIVLYGNSSVMSANHHYSAATTTTKKTTDEGPRTGLRRGDLAIVAPSAAGCGLIQITDNTNGDALTISHTNTNYIDEFNNPQTARFNDPAGYLGAPTTGNIYNLGDAPSRNVWQVNGRVLVVSNDLLNTAPTEIAEGIIDLQAQYGLDTDGDFIVDTWTDASAGTPTLLPIAQPWSSVRAVRFAILARSQHFEKDVVTTQAPETGWTDAGGDPVRFNMKDVDGGAPAGDNTANDWRHYRYRVYTNTIPLRNMVWGTMPGAPL